MSVLAAVATLRAQSYAITAIDFHPSNLRLVSGDEEGWCIQWSMLTRRPLAVWRSHEGSCLTVKWLSSELLLTHGRDNKLHVYRLDTVPLDTKLPKPEDSPDQWRKPWLAVSMDVNALNFCAAAILEPNRIAIPGSLNSDTIDVYDLLPQLLRPYKAITAEVKTGIVMAIELVQNVLVAGYESGHVAVYRLLDDGKYLRLYTCKSHSQPVLSIALHSSDSTFISSSADSKIVKHPLFVEAETAYLDAEFISESEPLKIVDIKHCGIASIDIRDDQKIFAVACWDGMVRVFLYKSLKLRASFRGGRQDKVSCAKFGYTKPIASTTPSTEPAASTQLVTISEKAIVSSAIKEQQEEKLRNKHWLAVGGKDGRIGLWEIY
ncbi:WD40 repeat-like protein [Lipomyces arxii]|uniref:WD40 repeat-like protein n=1 Tax=Lipomyces arxii TaxID=56418 RepID=UPI0034CD68A9